MAESRFPCLECGEPFDTREGQRDHWVTASHGPEQVQLDAVDRFRYGIMGDAAPEPESAYHKNTVTQRRRPRLTVRQGGRG